MSLEIAQADVRAFMLAIDQWGPNKPFPANFIPPGGKLPELYGDLVREEYEEFRDAVCLAEAVDGAIDLIWVTLGWLNAVGVDATPIWNAVQVANMTKVSGPVRADGKREKPPGFKHPDVAALIQAQRKS